MHLSIQPFETQTLLIQSYLHPLYFPQKQKQRPAAAQGIPVYAPVATHQAASASASAYYPTNHVGTAAAPLPRAELIYDGSAAVPARPTAPPAVVVGGQQGAAVAGADLYRPESGTARW